MLKNFYADMLAQNALKLLNHNLAKVLKNGADLEARQNMLVGSMLAGQAFANAPVAAVHASPIHWADISIFHTDIPMP
jgi:alcohol dehydrogenase